MSAVCFEESHLEVGPTLTVHGTSQKNHGNDRYNRTCRAFHGSISLLVFRGCNQ